MATELKTLLSDFCQDFERSSDVHLADVPVREVYEPDDDWAAVWTISVSDEVCDVKLQVRLIDYTIILKRFVGKWKGVLIF